MRVKFTGFIDIPDLKEPYESEEDKLETTIDCIGGIFDDFYLYPDIERHLSLTIEETKVLDKT